MKSLLYLYLICIILCGNFKALAQDWDDFDPPPATEYGGPSPSGNDPPPPPPSPGFDPGPTTWDPSNGSPRPSFGGSAPSGVTLGSVVFKKTGKKKDLTKKNARKEELIKQNP